MADLFDFDPRLREIEVAEKLLDKIMALDGMEVHECVVLLAMLRSAANEVETSIIERSERERAGDVRSELEMYRSLEQIEKADPADVIEELEKDDGEAAA